MVKTSRRIFLVCVCVEFIEKEQWGSETSTTTTTLKNNIDLLSMDNYACFVK